jgi:hypothetical protein
MPYVLPERRPELDKVVEALVKNGISWQDMIRFFEMLSIYGTSHIDWIGQYYPKDAALLKIAKEIDIKPNGDINYVLFKYCKYHVEPSYNNYKDFMGVIYRMMHNAVSDSYKNEFREAAEWIRIKLLIPYEEKKILENGDV